MYPVGEKRGGKTDLGGREERVLRPVTWLVLRKEGRKKYKKRNITSHTFFFQYIKKKMEDPAKKKTPLSSPSSPSSSSSQPSTSTFTSIIIGYLTIYIPSSSERPYYEPVSIDDKRTVADIIYSYTNDTESPKYITHLPDQVIRWILISVTLNPQNQKRFEQQVPENIKLLQLLQNTQNLSCWYEFVGVTKEYNGGSNNNKQQVKDEYLEFKRNAHEQRTRLQRVNGDDAVYYVDKHAPRRPYAGTVEQHKDWKAYNETFASNDDIHTVEGRDELDQLDSDYEDEYDEYDEDEYDEYDEDEYDDDDDEHPPPSARNTRNLMTRGRNDDDDDDDDIRPENLQEHRTQQRQERLNVLQNLKRQQALKSTQEKSAGRHCAPPLKKQTSKNRQNSVSVAAAVVRK